MSDDFRAKVMEEIIEFWINYIYGTTSGSLETDNNNRVNLGHLKRILGIDELEQKLTEHNGRFDNRCIDIETVLGINSKWEANNTKPFKQRIEALEKKFEISISNIDAQINTLNKESIDTNIIVRKTLDSWLEKNGERIVKEYVRKFDPSLFMELKFKENRERIEALEKTISSHHDISLIQTKEISELSKKHRESEFLQIEINKEFEEGITELKEEIKKINILYFDKKARYGYTNFYNRTHT
ncbi:hypothetical protein LCGC14_3073510, partial [marine sediment metagenome]